MANKISVLIDVATDKAVGGLKGFKAAINDADGATGKMKAGATQAFGAIQQHAATMALAAGGALVAFAAKGVTAFTSLALEAGKFRDTTGATIDEASRWIEVGDDIGLTGTQISGAWNKMNVAIGAGKPLLEEYGITLKKTADGQDDANGTFLHAIDVINGIKDPTKRAELAAATFGRGWTEMSELIAMGSGDIVTAMGEVSDAQIIDDAEVAKAKQFRASIDKLKDSVENLAMDVGEELTPAVSAFADTLAGVAPVVGEMASFVGGQFVKIADEAYEAGQTIAEFADALPFVEVVGLADGIEHTTYEFGKLERSVADNIAEWQQGVTTMDAFVAKLRAMGLSQDEINIAMAASKFSLNENTAATEELAAASDEVTESTETSTLAHMDAATAMAAREDAEKAAIQAAEDHAEAMVEQAEAYVENFEAANTWMGEVTSAMESAGGAISEFSDEALNDIDTFQQELSDNVAALAGWQTDLTTIAGATSEDFATYLAGMGLEGAELVDQLANNTPELETTFEQWKFATAVAGKDMVAEFAKVSPETLAEFEELGHQVASTIEGMGPLTAAEAQAVGAAIAAGVAAGVDINAHFIATSVTTALHLAIARGKEAIEAKSPSRLFADEVGKPIVWGIVAGIDEEEQKLIDAAQKAAESLVEGFEKEIESSTKDALKAVDDMVDEVADRFDDMWDVVEGRRDIEGLTEGVADAEAKLAETLADSDSTAENVADARERLEDANYRLLKASEALLDQGPAGEASFLALASAAGLEEHEIRNLILAHKDLVAARAEATAQTAAINAEASEAESIRARFGQAAAQGLARDWIDHIAQFGGDPAFQLELMRQFLATVPGFATGGIVPGVGPQLAVVHGGEYIMPANMTAAGSTAQFNVTVNMPPGADGDDVVRALQKFERRNGPGWRVA